MQTRGIYVETRGIYMQTHGISMDILRYIHADTRYIRGDMRYIHGDMRYIHAYPTVYTWTSYDLVHHRHHSTPFSSLTTYMAIFRWCMGLVVGDWSTCDNLLEHSGYA